MIKQDFHTHSIYCDGKSSLREMAESALQKGLSAFGFSAHPHMSVGDPDDIWFLSVENTRKYVEEAAALKEEYRGRIDLYCGFEWDRFADPLDPSIPYDFLIGSAHMIRRNGEYFPVDATKEILLESCEKYYNGDIYALIEDYYRGVVDMLSEKKVDVIGHFDLITKYNEDGSVFDAEDPRYLRAAFGAADEALRYDIPFEINTGAMSRGYRTEAYPSNRLITYIRDHGGRFILSSDAHHCDNICFAFDRYEKLAEEMGLELAEGIPFGTGSAPLR